MTNKKILILILLLVIPIDFVVCEEILTSEQKLSIFVEIIKNKNSDFCFYVYSNYDNVTQTLNLLETKNQVLKYVSKLESIYNNHQYSTGFKKIR